MPFSYAITTASAAQTLVSVPFPYSAESDVKLYKDGVLTAATWNTPSQLLMAAAVGGERLEVRRTTKADSAVVAFNPGTITSNNLNSAVRQLLYLVQESVDNAGQALGIDVTTGQFTARSLRITNVALPVADTDVATKAYIESYIPDLEAEAAAVHADMLAAQESADDSQDSAVASSGFATASASSATDSATQAGVALTRSIAAGAAQTAAEAARDKALAWANTAEDVPVPSGGGLFSALHWAAKSAASALTNFAAAIHAATAKTTIAAADEFGLWDSVSSAIRKVTATNLANSIAALVSLKATPVAGDNVLIYDSAASGISKRSTLSSVWLNIFKGLADALYASTGTPASFTTLSLSGLLTTTGGQIKFPATQVPSSDPNTLDDYEEGTFTPTIGGLTVGNGTLLGRYTKVGRSINVQYGFIFGTTSAVTGNLIFTMPFANLDNFYCGCASAFDNGTAVYIGTTFFQSTTTFYVFSSAGVVQWAAAIPFTWTNLDRFHVSMTYDAA